MKIKNIYFICLLILCSCLFGCAGAKSSSVHDNPSSPNSNSSTPDLAQQLDDYLHKNQKDSDDGISILAIKDGETIYACRGMADLNSRTPVSKQTAFHLASISKPFTAIAIMQLVERGQLNLSDSILTYIPELPSSWNAITIENLLIHRSGIYDIINDFWEPSLLNGLTNNTLIPYLRQHRSFAYTTRCITFYLLMNI